MSNRTMLYIGLAIAAFLIYQKINAASQTRNAPSGPGRPVGPLTQAQIDSMLVQMPEVVSATI